MSTETTEVIVEKAKKAAIDRLKPGVKTLADKILADLTWDPAAKKVTESEPNAAFYANLPNSWTPEAVEELNTYKTNFVAAGRLAVGQLAYDAMKGAKDLDEVSATLGAGGEDRLAVTVVRSKTQAWNDTSTGERKEAIKHGYTSVALTTAAGSNTGPVKTAGSAIAELFAGGI